MQYVRRLIDLLLVFGRWSFTIWAIAILTVVIIWARRNDAPGVVLTQGELLGLALVTALLATALVELTKRLTPVRGWFHRREIRRYLARDRIWSEWDIATQLDAALGDAVFSQRGLREWRGDLRSPAEKFREFRSHDLKYIYALPLEQLTAQIASAMEVALSDPRAQGRFQMLLQALGGDLAEQLAYEPNEGDDYVSLRHRVSNHIQRGLEALQIVIGHRWRWFLRSSVIVLVLSGALVASASLGLGISYDWLQLAMVTGMAGFLSWVIRDVVAGVERWRR